MPRDYKIVEGGLGYVLYWFDGTEWMWVMDSKDESDCLEYMYRDIRNAFIDRWGE